MPRNMLRSIAATAFALCVLGSAAHAQTDPEPLFIPPVITGSYSPLICRSYKESELQFDLISYVEHPLEPPASDLVVYFDANGVPIYDHQHTVIHATYTKGDQPNGNVVVQDQNWIRTRYYTDGRLNGSRTYDGSFEVVAVNGVRMSAIRSSSTAMTAPEANAKAPLLPRRGTSPSPIRTGDPWIAPKKGWIARAGGTA